MTWTLTDFNYLSGFGFGLLRGDKNSQVTTMQFLGTHCRQDLGTECLKARLLHIDIPEAPTTPGPKSAVGVGSPTRFQMAAL